MTDEVLHIENDALGVDFVEAEDSLTLSAFEHRPTGARFETGEGTIWELELRNEAGYRTKVDVSDAEEVEYDRQRETDSTVLTVHWLDVPVEFADTGRHGTLSVRLTVTVPDEDSAVRFRPRIKIDAPDCTLWQAVFPAMRDLHRSDADRSDDRLLLPDGWGANVRDPTGTGDLRSWPNETYPSGSTTMQFLALRNGDAGLYLGLHDSVGRPKDIGVESPTDARRLAVRISHHPEGMGTDQSVFDPGYDVVVACYTGDWHEPANRYREWALESAEWTDAGPVVDRDDVPDWFPEVCLWWAPGFDAAIPTGESEQSCDPAQLLAAADLIEDVKEELPVPTACHWYHWHQVPFDTSYPDYDSAREGFAELVTRLQDAGVHVMPYINARLADPNSNAWTDHDLHEAAAKPASARLDPASDIPSYEEYGNEQLLVPMCSATDSWRETIRDIVHWLADELGVDAVYLDQIAAVEPPRCFDPDHDHAPGGGGYGVSAYRNLLTDLADSTALALTSECNAEPYMDGVSGYLLWHAARADSVPLFQAVYGDYTVAFGRHFVSDDLENDARPFRTKLAQLFDHGGQLGWMPLSVARGLQEQAHQPSLQYLRRTATSLHAASKYLLTGRRLADPEPTTDIATEAVTWAYHNQEWEVELPAVLASAWEPPTSTDADGVALAFTNWTDTERVATWSLAEPTFDPDSLTITELSDSGSTVETTNSDERAEVSATLPALSSTVVRLDDTRSRRE